ncbi:MAG: SDR family NAD(P)-dependent oxidoreductase [Candidatus Gottesmanbacteria bacterium]|nr:SDR family NAD(P)-dependent oxidoreductase [Candidatus Gottesmanbacteria bacterium]
MKNDLKTPIRKDLEVALAGKTILITGGTGSFGHTVAVELLHYDPQKIIIYSRDEKKQDDMRNEFNNPKLTFIIGDVRDEQSVMRAIEGVDYIFHAAALKQVPSCEFFPMEAVKTNIIGTHNVLSAAAFHKVKRVVVLSTDKAVYPINAMGMAKALMEKTMIAAAKNYPPTGKSGGVYCGVRYGNVLYSRGSVIPFYIDLMKKKQKLTLTYGSMTRFLLPLRDAVGLVMYALTHGESGHIYVRKAPACSVETLAQAMCKLFGYKEGYEEIGMRAGEKIHETLVSKEEMARAHELDNYFDIPPESQGLDYNKYLLRGGKEQKDVDTIDAYTSASTIQLDVAGVIALLRTLPEIQQALRV